MAGPRRTIKGLASIRTLTRKGVTDELPHESFMRLSCLEMEKLRKQKERDLAAARIKEIDARFQEIDAEIAGILAKLKHQAPAHSVKTAADLKTRSGSFKIRY